MTGAVKEQDRKIVLELKNRLSADLQKRVIKFIIYGSRAKGVDAEDSDLDLVALVDEKTPEIERALDDLAYGVMWDYDFKPVISFKGLLRGAFPHFHGKRDVILQARRKRRHFHMTEFPPLGTILPRRGKSMPNSTGCS